MFPHLTERVILTSAAKENGKIADNVALINGLDLSAFVERTEVKKVRLLYSLTASSLKILV